MTSFIPAVCVCFVYRRVNASATDIFSFVSCFLCVCVSVCVWVHYRGELRDAGRDCELYCCRLSAVAKNHTHTEIKNRKK